MKNFVILHGTQGSPGGNWFRWLERELTKKGHKVWLPQLPHAEQPSLREWIDYVHAECPFSLDEKTTIIGHSSGAILALLLAQESKTKLEAVVCVSVFYDNSLKWSANDRLFDVDFDWEKIRGQVKHHITCIHSDDDPYVPVSQAKFVADAVNARLVMLPGQGHFNLEKSESYTEFPEILEYLEERI